MNKLSLLLILLISFGGIQSQEINIYGFLPSNNPDTEFLRLGNLDPLTGVVVSEDSIYPVNAYALGSSTFDAVNSAFIFLGVDTAFDFRLYTRALRSNVTLSDPKFGETINDLQYDMNSMSTYGLGNYYSDSVLIDSANNIWWYEYATRFLKIDQDSGYITELNQMPDIEAFPVGSSTFDANNGRYIVNAYDTAFDERLVIIEAATGVVLSKEPTGLGSGEYLNNLEYNNEDDKVYGLYRASNATYTAIVSLDLNNEIQMDTIYVFDDLKYFIQGAAVLHQASQLYMMFYIDVNNTSRIAIVNLTTGELTANPALTESLSEIEVDNSVYALAKYHETVSILEKGNEKLFVVYPNPVAKGQLLKLTGNVIPDEVTIYDLNGQISLAQSAETLSMGTLNLGNLGPGIYFVSIHSASKLETHKLLIR